MKATKPLLSALGVFLSHKTVAAVGKSSSNNPTQAFTYTAQNQNWMDAVDQGGFESVYVYAGDVEFYCRGSPTAISGGSPSPTDVACSFDGSDPNAFVYYSDFAKNASAAYKAAGKQVYINFDGRISPKLTSFVPNFDKLSAKAISQFASATANLVCGDDNVDGMAWDVEPFSNDQIPFFAELDKHIAACGKTWGVFGFGETLNATMWTEGLGSSGFLFDSAYDLDCSSDVLPPHGCLPCQCTPPDVYETVLTDHVAQVMKLAKTYQKPYRLMVSGSGTTQLYEEISTATCTGAGGGPVYDKTCDYTMADWMTSAVSVFDKANVKGDPNFAGIGIYGWTTTDGGGFSPTVPPASGLQVLSDAGYLPYASSNKQPYGLPLRSSGTHNKNKCLDDHDYKTCPQHFMVGSPMNIEI
jgi:hypothetical protein